MSKELRKDGTINRETSDLEIQRLEVELQATRNQLDQRVNEINRRMDPQYIKGAMLKKAADKITETKDNLAQSAGEAYENTRDKVVENYRYTKETTARKYDENPLLACGIAFGAGLLLGSLFPVAQRERELLKEPASRFRDELDERTANLVEQGKAKLSEQADQLKGSSSSPSIQSAPVPH